MTILDNQPFGHQPTKVVCVGRNYAAHAKELNNPIPTTPLLFIKPSTSLCPLSPSFSLVTDQGECHIETEIALLVGETISNEEADTAWSKLAGIGLGFDLTLRDLQSALKEKGHPWERAKAFDNSCPMGSFVSVDDQAKQGEYALKLVRNGQLQQQGRASDMITPMAQLLAHISRTFTLLPGDIVLTGTPAGVCALAKGDQLSVELSANGQVILAHQTVVA